MRHQYTETPLETKYGKFIIRVYADTFGRETIVLYSVNLKTDQSVLTRIHSECLTGDALGSLQCDCGEQLSRSLEIIQKNGNGVLIYLRQEGRGIGLYEKIQSYQLQSKGFDTFEANVMLGHRPDERSYEWAKTALIDLKISSIKLLTNNPTKVSEIAKLGILVTERVPLVMDTNEFNRKYFDAKRDKFKHFFSSEVSYYFYQFHVQNAHQVEEIGEFLRGKKGDPLLKICVGVYANHETLTDSSADDNLKSIFRACEFYEEFVPILHFSFANSNNPIRDLEEIRIQLPFVKYIQINDLAPDNFDAIELACKLFLADVPLDDKNFHLIHDEKFRTVITKNKAFLLLDNSKGTGVREPKESLEKKIDTLLGYGLNDIAIFGGFGPDDLDTYFELRRHYRINFSIDAESRLKTDGQIDIEKTKVYLRQLLRFDDPNEAGIEQTRSFLRQNKASDWTTVKIDEKKFRVHPAVFNPGLFPSTDWFANRVSEQMESVQDFCEIGCGAGVISCLIASRFPHIKVVASDINPFAMETTKLNASHLGLTNIIEVFAGDVFDSIPEGKKFDVIFWALPFGFLDPGTTVSIEDMQVFDPGYRATRKFLKEARHYLRDNGKVLIGFSSDLGHEELLTEIARDEKMTLIKVAEDELQESKSLHFELLQGSYINI